MAADLSPPAAQKFTELVRLGQAAERERHWEKAAEYYQIAIASCAVENWWVFRRAAECLTAAGLFDRAEIVLDEGCARFPDEPAMYFDRAKLSEHQRLWPEAASRFAYVISRFPADYLARIKNASALIHLHRFPEAQACLADAIAEFPAERRAYVSLASLMGSLPASDRLMSVSAMRALISRHLNEHGDTPDMLDACANLHRIEGNYRAFHEMTQSAIRKYPDHVGLRKSHAAAQEILLGQGSMDIADSVPQPASGEVAAIFAACESLGGGSPDAGHNPHGCEFGYIQREFLLEPLGLLRWASIAPGDLIRALNERFELAGIPETTQILSRGGTDWGYVDTSYQIRVDHTHMPLTSISEERARRSVCQLVNMLRRKLIEDFEAGSKLFVYRYLSETIADAMLSDLVKAMNSYGKNTVLVVLRQSADNPPFKITCPFPGAMVGYIDWFAADDHGNRRNVVGWSRLCSDAFRLWKDLPA